jgi:hypothetical protein
MARIDDVDYQELRDKPSKFVRLFIDVDPFIYQSEFMDNDSDRKVFVAGRQVGKSRVASWLALHHAVTHPDSLVLVTADALRQSSELFAQLQSEINNSGLSDDHWGIERMTQTEIEFEHGSRIKVVPTGRNGNKIRGFTADMIIVDEAAFVENEIFEEVIEPMTFVSDGTIVMTSTPYGASGYFYEKANEAKSDPESRWYRTHVESDDNPEIDEEDIEEFKQGKTRAQIQREVLGEFVPAGDQFFPNHLLRSTISDDTARGVVQYGGPETEKRTDGNADVYLGVDLGAGGADDTVFTKVDEYGNVFDITINDMGVVEARKHIEQLDRYYGFEKINVDQTGIGEGPVGELRKNLGRKVEGVYLSTQKKQSVYQTLKAHMESGEVSIINHEDARLQLEKLGYKKTRSNNLSIHAKEGFHDDIPDSIALAVWALPNTAGSGSMGAQGATKPVTIGQVEEQADGSKAYSFQGNDDEPEQVSRSLVGSSKRAENTRTRNPSGSNQE